MVLQSCRMSINPLYMTTLAQNNTHCDNWNKQCHVLNNIEGSNKTYTVKGHVTHLDPLHCTSSLCGIAFVCTAVACVHNSAHEGYHIPSDQEFWIEVMVEV